MSLLDILRKALVRPDEPVSDPPAATSFRILTESGQLDTLFAHSKEGPVVIFKHDPFCSISSRAYDQVSRVGSAVAMIDVSRDRDLSFDVASQTGVKHESPQIIVLRDGATFWHASHGSVTTSGVRDALERARAV
ncbi:MAG: bacillithiol system redox-active protein YtxJ [Chloroflexi bacterium]|nr:bacillithiol system redox-active protein YtxJ [Chloroflexota bacterium]